jgi:predicted dehydrogenase
VRRVQAETKRIYSIYYSEHFAVRCVVRAGELVRAGTIGTVVNIVGLGPHRIDRVSRPGWFFERERYGGILADIASHQIEQFLFFTGAEDAEVICA